MKAYITVMVKESMHNPQDRAATQALAGCGVKEAKQGKYFDINLTEGNLWKAYRTVRELCETVLANPVYECFQFDLKSEKGDETRDNAQSPWFYYEKGKWQKKQIP